MTRKSWWWVMMVAEFSVHNDHVFLGIAMDNVVFRVVLLVVCTVCLIWVFG